MNLKGDGEFRFVFNAKLLINFHQNIQNSFQLKLELFLAFSNVQSNIYSFGERGDFGFISFNFYFRLHL